MNLAMDLLGRPTNKITEPDAKYERRNNMNVKIYSCNSKDKDFTHR